MTEQRPLVGAAWMLAAAVAFAGLGAAVKVVSEDVGTGEIVAWRSAVSAAVMGAVVVAGGRSLRPSNLRMHVVRGVGGVMSMALYFEAIARLPLGDAVLITYLSPLLVAAASPLVGEQPPRRIWIAIGVGLLGLALVVGPAGSEDAVGLACALLAAVCAASSYLTVRTLTRTESTEVIVFWFGVLGAVLASPSLLNGSDVGSAWSVGLLVLIGVLGAIAQWCMTTAYAHADAAQVSVVQYATPVLAYLAGLVMLGEVPGPQSVAGAVLVAIAGGLAASK